MDKVAGILCMLLVAGVALLVLWPAWGWGLVIVLGAVSLGVLDLVLGIAVINEIRAAVKRRAAAKVAARARLERRGLAIR
jgi:hypothetical protein